MNNFPNNLNENLEEIKLNYITCNFRKVVFESILSKDINNFIGLESFAKNNYVSVQFLSEKIVPIISAELKLQGFNTDSKFGMYFVYKGTLPTLLKNYTEF